jgi:predicted nucleic acid-binding protein
MHRPARDGVAALLRKKEVLHIVPQNIYEGWVVATRPIANNGLGLAPRAAEHLIARTAQFCHILPDTPDIYREWLALVTKYGVVGVNAHDTRLVAAMKVHRINHLLTFNYGDFRAFDGSEIIVVNPQAVALT